MATLSAQSFAVETTLRTNAAIDQAVLAHRSGFVADMHFVATDSIAENVARVLQRFRARVGEKDLMVTETVTRRPSLRRQISGERQ